MTQKSVVYLEVGDCLSGDLGTPRQVEFPEVGTVLCQSLHTLVCEVVNAGQGYHGQLGAVDGHLAHTLIGQVTVSEADLLNGGAAVRNCLGYIVVDLLETSHGNGLQLRAAGHYSLHQSWGQLCEEKGQTETRQGLNIVKQYKTEKGEREREREREKCGSERVRG